MKIVLSALLSVFAIPVLAQNAATAPTASYAFYSLNIPPPNSDVQIVGPEAVNDSGDTAGQYYDWSGNQFGFVKTASGFSSVNPANAVYGTVVQDINNSAQITGYYVTADNIYQGFVFLNGSFSLIDIPGGQAIPAGISEKGHVVGTLYEYIEGIGLPVHGFVLADGIFSLIDYPGAHQTFAIDINSSGEIIGGYEDVDGRVHGFLKSGGSFTSIDFPGALLTQPNSINDVGQIAGVYITDTPERGFLFAGGSYTTLDFPGANNTHISKHTNAGTVIGNFDGNNWFLAYPALSVQIDLKPGTSLNTINVGSSGTVAVAILSSPTFDARTIDPSSVTLASAPVKLKGKGTPMSSLEDVDGDGRLDIIVHVDTTAFQVSNSDTQVRLQGRTFAGKYLVGSDTVRVLQ